ncbi:glycosyltransferase family A protein [Micromonospora sp. NPDC049891]|uniref:glycosyltransferase family A protein n=1 Tax=Micromonospora sp. NPDC049891 TaxID=3155655 RepID=UPI0033E8FEDC
MSGPSWSILIPTIGQREVLFRRLLDVLLPQLDPFGGRVRVLGWWNNGSPTLGEIRQALVEAAGTDYVCFVDDDDMVPDYYVAEIVRALESEPDHVGFKVDYFVEGQLREVVDHSLRYRRWYRDANGLYRDFTHIDPLRRDLALRGDFRRRHRRGRAEDRPWVKQVRPYVHTEEYVDKVMYHYLWSEHVSAWQRPEKIRQGFRRPQVDHPHFVWHPESARG